MSKNYAIAGHCPECGGQWESKDEDDIYICGDCGKRFVPMHDILFVGYREFFGEYEDVGEILPSREAVAIENMDEMLELLKNYSQNMGKKGIPKSKKVETFLAKIGALEKEPGAIGIIDAGIRELKNLKDAPDKIKHLESLDEDTPRDEK